MYQKNCVICGKEFQSKRPERKYCSKICSKKSETISAAKRRRERATANRKYKICPTCNEEFLPHIRAPFQIYCSQQCGSKAHYARAIREGRAQKQWYLFRKRHPEIKRERDRNYKDRIRFGGNKYKVLERDGYKCVQCGKDNPRSLIIHHKDHSGSSDNPNNDMDNLITLCRSCHMRYHALNDPKHVMYKRHQKRKKKV